MNDPFDLERFVTAQNGQLDDILAELRQGRKTSHWIWFVFPQVKGLGNTYNANHFGISSLAEAEAYLQHPLLGQRLLACTALVMNAEKRSLEEIFGSIDSIKFRSSMTLFAQLGKGHPIFAQALAKYCDGKPDRLTLEMLGKGRETD
jgi:uncharacterized protein (DUF1810 family)